MDISKSEYLFVYGTLMKQYPKNTFLGIIQQHATYLSTAFTSGQLYIVDYYPGLVEHDSFEYVYGERYQIHDSTTLFKKLDVYEDYDPTDEVNSLFVRKKILVYEGIHKPPALAWTYTFNKPTALLQRIKSGNYMDFVSENEDK
jgi:gamma-glutamylcyclotransferase (GGCT)/AIG2-like uncharacterized protein YtfP